MLQINRLSYIVPENVYILREIRLGIVKFHQWSRL